MYIFIDIDILQVKDKFLFILFYNLRNRLISSVRL